MPCYVMLRYIILHYILYYITLYIILYYIILYYIILYYIILYYKKVTVKQSRYRPGQVQMVSGGRGSQISKESAHDGGKIVSLTHWPPLPPRK